MRDEQSEHCGALRFTAERFQDIDAQAAQLCGHGQRYVQLSRGPFEGRFASAFLRSHMNVHFERVNRVVVQTGRSPSDRYTALFLNDDSPPCRLDGAVFTRDDIATWPPDHDWDAVTAAGMHICVVDFDLGVLPDSRWLGKPAQIMKAPLGVATLRAFLTDGLSQLRDGRGRPHDASIGGFAAAMATLLPFQLHDRKSGEIRARHTARVRLVRGFRDMIDAGLSHGINVTSLSRQAGMTRRSVEKLFGSALGTSPAHYIRVLRLHRIRRDLLSDEHSSSSIGDIVSQYGIWHLSRFAADYRAMFGELPSLARPPLGRQRSRSR